VARVISALVAFVIAWQLALTSGLINSAILPGPLVVATTILDLLFEPAAYARDNPAFQLIPSAGLTVMRVLVGLAAATIVGVPVGFAIAWYRVAGTPIDWIVRALRTIPGLAWVPLAIAWFGVGIVGPVFIVTITILFPVVIATVHGVRTLNPIYVHSLRTLGADELTTFREVVLPGAVPSILTGIRVGLNIGWWSVISAEMFGATGGLGFLITYYNESAQIANVVAVMVTIGVVNALVDLGFRIIDRRLRAWQGRRGNLKQLSENAT